MPDPIIRLEDVTFTYTATETPALRGVDLEVQRGEYLGIAGLNGAGKTTLALAVNGVVPSMLTGEFSGRVTVRGLDVADYAVRELARLVGVVFDNPEFQMSQLTVAEEVALGLESTGVPRGEMGGIIAKALRTVGLHGVEERSPLALSGGQQQRLAIASVLAMSPEILILDEPTSNLDPVGKQDVFEIAARLNRDQGLTVIVIEHEVDALAEYADRIVVMDHGRVAMSGSPGEVFGDTAALATTGLRPPESASVAAALDEAGLWSGGPYPVLVPDAIAAVGNLLGVRS